MPRTPKKATTKNKYYNKYSRTTNNKTHTQCAIKRGLIKDRLRFLEAENKFVNDVINELIERMLNIERRLDISIDPFGDMLKEEIPSVNSPSSDKQTKLIGKYKSWTNDPDMEDPR